MKALIPFFAASFFLALPAAAEKPAEPYANPHLAASNYPVVHARATFSSLAGPIGPSRRLRADEIRHKPLGPLNGAVPVYSGPYPNGKRVIWIGGYDRAAKLDADTLEVLTEYTFGGNTYFDNDVVKRHLATMDRLGDKERVDYALKLWAEPFRNAGTSAYHLLSRDNEFYLPHRAADGAILLQVYGEADAGDPASKILLRREWKLPTEISRDSITSVAMTSDGWIAMATQDGVVIALSRDFSTHHVLTLPRQHEEPPGQDFFSAFVRNGIVTDDQGGIYIVTRDHMHRVQWTGRKLSLDAADGGWSAPYPNERGIGSGATPALMGWGPREDHLVVITDGSRSNNMVAFWRDAIPGDWKGLPGLDRRIAGITPIHFGTARAEEVKVENTPVVYGYGAFFNNNSPVQKLPDQGGASKQFFAEAYYFNVPGHEAKGGAMIRWDPQARALKTAWQSQTNFVSTVCTVSGATEILYCWGARNREWTLEGTDWHTGKSAFHYTLGNSQRFNPFGGVMTLVPDGAVDCGCIGSLGIVRVRPKQGAKR